MEGRADGKNSPPWTTVQKVLLMEGAPVITATTSSLYSPSLSLTGFLYYYLLLCNHCPPTSGTSNDKYLFSQGSLSTNQKQLRWGFCSGTEPEETAPMAARAAVIRRFNWGWRQPPPPHRGSHRVVSRGLSSH